MTILECASAAARVLVEAGFAPDDARRDAFVLARHALDWTLTDWAGRSREPAPPALGERLLAMARRRATREPVAYVTGTREFFGRAFRVTPAVLIPRPETEILVEAALALLRSEASAGSADPRVSPVILDVGTGSGCIAITLALECPAARITAADVSPTALGVAMANADALGAGRIEFVEASLVPARLLPRPGLIVSNPPYVPERDRAALAPDVRDFEPGSALFAGPDGLDVIRQLVPEARAGLRPRGWLVMEIGAGQAQAVSDIVLRAGFTLDHIRPDLQGIPRVVVARQP